MTLLTSNYDGRHRLSQAMLAVLQNYLGDGLESSWNETTKEYQAEPFVNFWDYSKVKGYIVSLVNKDKIKQFNIALVTGANGDHLCLVWWLSKPELHISAEDCPDPDSKAFNINKFRFWEIDHAAHTVYQALKRFWDKNTID